MIHFVTVHFESSRWIDIQLTQIARHTKGEYNVWGCLNGIDSSFNSRFHRVVELQGLHAEKLNAMANLVSREAAPDDLLVFIDGDAFPIDDFVEPISSLLAQYRLIAVKRPENVGDPQPHPCFTVTTVGFWNEIGGDWTLGERPHFEWPTAFGQTRTDVGARVMQRLEQLGRDWYPLLRSNTTNLHPVMFGVYGDLVYHHGCGFRNAHTAWDAADVGFVRWRGTKLHRFGKWRLDRRAARNRKISERVYREISADVGYIRRRFLAPRTDHASAAPQVASGR